jgi:hypothetical protein
MLYSMVDMDSLSEAERRLVEAVKRESKCDFSDGEVIQPGDMANWGVERTIRAAVLKRLLTGDAACWGVESTAAQVKLRGAVVSGDPIRFDKTELCLQMWGCLFTGGALFDGADFFAPYFDGVIFTGGASFKKATFTGGVYFDGATFAGAAAFDGATFAGAASFDGATFAGAASFDGATIEGDASFPLVTFTRDASFNRATFARRAFSYGVPFNGDASFYGATSADRATFNDAAFNGTAMFGSAIFTGDARFKGTTLNDAATFDRATITGAATFDHATFNGRALFDDALAGSWSFKSSTFMAPNPGPWIGRTVSLDDAVLAGRTRISITASEKIDARSLHAREGAHLILSSKEVDLGDSEFLRRSILAGPGTAKPSGIKEMTYDDPFGGRGWPSATATAKEFRDKLARELPKTPRCRLISLKRSTAGELVLADVVLDDCEFAGAHGLDKMRIGADCSFGRTRDRSSEDAFTRRRTVPVAASSRSVNSG